MLESLGVPVSPSAQQCDEVHQAESECATVSVGVMAEERKQHLMLALGLS